MAHSTRTLPIIIASVVAVTLVAGAYVLSGPVPFIDRVTAESSEALLKAYATKDQDADGLTDWQEALYGTDPTNPTSFRADLLDGEAARQELLTPKSLSTPQNTDPEIPGNLPAPSSITEQFSRKFLTQYISTRGTEPPSEEEMLRFILSAVEDLQAARRASPEFSRSHVQSSGAGDAAAFERYAAAVESAMVNNSVEADKPDLDYFALALQNNDKASLAKLKSLAGGYEAVARALIDVQVPAEASAAHLALANALFNMGIAVGDLATLESDPIRALLGIGGYQEYERDLALAYQALHRVLTAEGVRLEAGEPGYAITEAAAGADRILKQVAP